MKNIKNISKAYILALSIIMLLFTGCDKQSTTTDLFKTLASENGMTTIDATEQFSDYEYIKEVTFAISDGEAYQFEFYVFSDASKAHSFFEEKKIAFDQNTTKTSTKSSNSGENFENYSSTTESKYMFLEYLDNTVLSIDVGKEYKKTAEKFIKELDY